MAEISTRLPVHDHKGKVVDNIQLDKELFDGFVNKTLLYEAKKMYEANMRQGTLSAKTRAEVAGGGAKPWRQKGTGRARVGSSRNPIWRHGGVAFPPKPRDFSYSMPKKALKQALLSSLNARLSEQRIKAIVRIELEGPKTGAVKDILDHLKVEDKTLLVVDALADNVRLSARNIKKLTLMEGRNVNARDVLLNENIVIEKEAFEKLAERLK